MTEQTTETTEQPGPVELARNAAALAEAAAEHATSAATAAAAHRDAVFAYAVRAEEHKDAGQLAEAGDQASAADAHANRARRAHDDAARHVSFAEQHRRVVAEADGHTDDDLAAAVDAINRAAYAAERTRLAADAAAASARTAAVGIDWAAYHMRGHCHGWKQRADFQPEAVALTAAAPLTTEAPPF
jgi:hypothetical protein